MSRIHLKTLETRVGVVGLYHAGKTVFLTSLINHLEHHDPGRFRLGSKGTARIERFRSLPPDADWAGFNYAGFRDALVHQRRWPEKTRDRSQYVCQFERSDWAISQGLVKFFDLPGERLADAAMLGRTYDRWSDHVLSLIGNDTRYRESCTEYLELLRGPSIKEQNLTAAYKLALARLILGCNPLITPSTFLLDVGGTLAKPDTPENLAASRSVGLGPDAEFVPPPPAIRQSQPDLAGIFAQRYTTYGQQVVAPFLKALRSCHALIVLVDVPSLLASGVGMYDDNRQILQDLFQVLDPGENLIEAVGRNLADLLLPHDWRPGGIRRVAFVAPKLDMVHPLDRDKVLTLLRRMVTKLAEQQQGLEAGYFNCSGVLSTRPLSAESADRWLVGIPYRNAEGKKIPPGAEQRFQVSVVPEDWPLNWSVGDYVFPDVYPIVPARKDFPPEQINLDRIFNFVVR